jgi:ATP-binding cassette subfamily C protein CydC
MSALLAFLPLFARLQRPLLLTLLLSLVTLAAGTALLGVSGWFLTAAALSTAGAAFNLFGPSAGVRGLSFVRILSRYGEKLSGHDATLRLLSDLRRWLFARLFPLAPLGRQFGRGDLVSRLLADIEALDTMFLVALGPISTAVIAGIGMTILLAFVLPGAAAIYAVAFSIATIAVPMALVAASHRRATRAAVATSDLRAAVLDGIDGHQDLVLFGESDAAVAEISEAAGHLGRNRRSLGLNGAIASAAVQSLMAVSLIGTLVVVLGALQVGAIGGPLMVGLLLAVIASFEASAMLVRSATRLAGSAAAAQRLKQVADLPPVLVEPAEPVELPAWPMITFEAVCFGYAARRPILDHLSFTVRPGELLAITGPSGSGKSTIARLLLRLADPQSGVIRFGGSDIRGATSPDLHRRIALMTQDTPVFLDTVRANLLIGRPDATDAELWEVLESVTLAEFVHALPGQLAAYVGEAGRTLSSGQARRLCLARTLLSRADVIVLDEPTSGLDRFTEYALLTQLPALLAGRTAIVITHAEIPAAFDRALELRAGQVQELRYVPA